MSKDMDKSAPRFQAGSMSLPEGAGNITGMFSTSDFLEIYTETETYRVKSPETIDPEVTNPNAPWVSSKSSDFGSSSIIVARVLLQGSDMVGSLTTEDKDRVLRQLHTCKEALLACEKVRLRVTEGAESIVNNISKNGVNLERGRHVKDFPQVPNLEDDASSFLINIKRAIVCICYLASSLLPLPKKDNNLEHLKKSLKKLNDNRYDALIKTTDGFILGTKHLIELRNFQEHPGDKITYIENFTVTPKNEVGYPVWYVKGNDPESIVASMKSAIEFVVTLSESMLVHYLLASTKSKFPQYVEEIPEKDIDPKKPIRYRLSIDIGSIKFER
jgi:hypothetical protein